MKDRIIKSLSEETKISKNSYFKYGFLIIILILIGINLFVSVTYNKFDLISYVVPIMLLLNHIAFGFTLTKKLRVLLRIIAWSWVVFGFLYILQQFLE